MSPTPKRQPMVKCPHCGAAVDHFLALVDLAEQGPDSGALRFRIASDNAPNKSSSIEASFGCEGAPRTLQPPFGDRDGSEQRAPASR